MFKMHTHVHRFSVMFYCLLNASRDQSHLCYMCNTHPLFRSSFAKLSKITGHQELETNLQGNGFCLGHRHFLSYHVSSRIDFTHVKKVKLLTCFILNRLFSGSKNIFKLIIIIVMNIFLKQFCIKKCLTSY